MADAAKCDYCGNYGDRPFSVDIGGGYAHRLPAGLPDGWVRLMATTNNDPAIEADVVAEYCGWECAASAIEREAGKR